MAHGDSQVTYVTQATLATSGGAIPALYLVLGTAGCVGLPHYLSYDCLHTLTLPNLLAANDAGRLPPCLCGYCSMELCSVVPWRHDPWLYGSVAANDRGDCLHIVCGYCVAALIHI